MGFLRRLTATHKTELFLFALAAAFDLSFGIEKLFLWLDHPLSNGWLAVLYLSFGLLVSGVGIFNLVRDIDTDCPKEKP
jgi:hypothetical protein